MSSSINNSNFSGVNNTKFVVGNDIKKTHPTLLTKSEPKPNSKSIIKPNMEYVSAGIALASLGVTGLVTHKFMKNQKILQKEIASKMKATSESFGKKLDIVSTDVAEVKTDTAKTKKWYDGYLNSHDKKFQQLETEVSTIKPSAIGVTRAVTVNGKSIPLMDVLNPIGGKANEDLEHTLRSESTKRLLGLSKGLEKVPEDAMIRIPTSEIKPYSSTGGMAVVPKEIAENLSKITVGKQNVSVVIDTPLYLGNVEKNTFNSINYNPKTDTYNYVSTSYKNGTTKTSKLAELQKIDTMEVPIYTDSGKTIEKVNMYMAHQEIPINYEEQSKSFTPELIKNIDEALSQENGVFENNNLIVKQGKDGKRKAAAKISAVFYEHPKFKMDAPIDRTSNIYSNEAISAGETERFTYFSKFFYEHLVDGGKSKVPLKADLILGNDWQTGPISAMTRQLTTAKKAYGMDPKVADKIQNTPIVTIMHNAGLSGGAWHSQPKLLNVMFGEHAAKIVENSHMPNLNIAGKGGLPGHLQNGLFEADGINPQMMATAYSDYIIPVSKGYSKEMSTMDVYGGARKPLFEFRARATEEYADVDNLKVIASQNGIKPSEVVDAHPTMIGITNGSDKINNTLTNKKAGDIAKALEMNEKSFTPYVNGENALEWHNSNKKAYLNKVIDDINVARNSKGETNPMNIAMPESTDLTGVTEKTPVFVSAGRIVDQKGLDIFAEGIKEFYKDFKGKDAPVFYVQGIGDEKYKNAFLAAKKEVAKTNPDGAKRIVFAGLFSEPGRYDGAKIMSDFSVMPSWFEPCGLVHKEIGSFSGAIPIVNRTGGLVDGFKEGENIIVSEFNPDRKQLATDGKNFATAIKQAVDIHADDNKFGSMVKSVMDQDFSWTKKNGPIFEYTNIFAKMNVLKPEFAINP